MRTEDFKKLLDEHDWYYEYSDDQKVWREGRENQLKILKLVEDFPEKFGELYDKKRQEMFPNGKR